MPRVAASLGLLLSCAACAFEPPNSLLFEPDNPIGPVDSAPPPRRDAGPSDVSNEDASNEDVADADVLEAGTSDADVLDADVLEAGTSDSGAADAEAPDAGGPCSINPAARFCDGRALLRCRGAEPEIERTCPYICSDAACVAPRHLSENNYANCGAEAPALRPPAGATIRIERVVGDAPSAVIRCAPSCGGEITEIAARGRLAGSTTPWFCLSAVDLPANTTLTASASLSGVVFAVDGPVTLAGTIDLSGGNATDASAGPAGPGGSRGGGISIETGLPGDGSCGGLGGTLRAAGANRAAGGGGGGASGQNLGGGGGTGRINTAGGLTAAGGASSTCSADSGNVPPSARPLIGGGGGASGAQGECEVSCGWAGGGGGGALALSSRRSILLRGTVRAAGGAGFGVREGSAANGGGGGGGAGGYLFFEAPDIRSEAAARLEVPGGAGGAAGGNAGGASQGLNGEPGVDALEVGGGSGGAGAAGLVHFRGGDALVCSQSLPLEACAVQPLAE